MDNDLISREVLKGIWELYKQYQPRLATNVYKFGVALKDIIDNAPTVDIVFPTINVNIPEKTKQELIEELQKPHKLLVLPEPEVEYPFYQEAYQTGYEEGRKDFERPKGKWIYKEFDAESGISRSYWCSNCGEPKSQWCDDFCQRCGADMRKGGAE